MSLHALAGHGDLRRTLARARLEGGIPSALLLHGSHGIGKQRLALWTGQLLLCEAPSADGPCGTCRACRLALNLEHPDLHLYVPLVRPKGVSGDRLADALESARAEALAELRLNPLRPGPSDEVRGLYLGSVQRIRRRAHMKPTMSSIQVFIVAESEFLVPQESSPEAANALLKLLEEPPAGTSFILTSSEPGRLPSTIRSRTVPLHLSPLRDEEVSAFLCSVAGVAPDAARRAAQLSQGSIGRALGFLQDGDGPGPLEALRQRALDLVEAGLLGGAAAGYAAALSFQSAGGRALTDLLSFVAGCLRDVAAVAADAEDRVVDHAELPRLRKLVERSGVTAAGVADVLPALEECGEMARGNVNPQLIFAELLRRLRGMRPSPHAEVSR